MSIQNYLTLSHLRKAVAAITQRIDNLRSNWDAKAGEEGYIENRTHWKEVNTFSIVPEQSVELDEYDCGYITNVDERAFSLQLEDIITVNCEGIVYNCVVSWIGNNQIYFSDEEELIYGGLFSEGSYICIYDDNISSTVTISATATSTTYHKLNSQYLDGKLIIRGTGEEAEIFNDVSNNTASGNYSHAEGGGTTASGNYSHAEGHNTYAVNYSSHAEGENTSADGYASHAEGMDNSASGSYSHAEGMGIIAQRRSQHAFGEYNIYDSNGTYTSDRGTYVEIVGNGTNNNSRSNARTLDWNGNEVLAGKLTIGTAPTNDMDVATKKYVDDATSGITSDLVGLTDTTITSPSNGQFLQYNSTSSKWENKTYTAPVTSVNGQTGAVTVAIPTKTSELTNDSGFLTSHQSLANYVTLNGNQTITGTKTFSNEVTFSASGASDISYQILCAFKVNRGQITNFFTQNIYTKTNDITFYKYSTISAQAPASPTTLFTIKNGGTVSIGTTSDIPSITADNELTTKKYVDDAISGIGTGAGTLSISANVITLTGSDGTTSSVTLPVYNGGVSS